jgi:hypothetical protein
MKKKLTDKAGYIMLGVAVDYFLFKPARALKPLWTFWVGVVAGVLWSVGMERFMEFVNYIQ